jgi:hypothetical protein
LILRLVRALGVAALWISLGVYGFHVTHDFYHHVDRAVWVTTDDGEASIAYALAHHGRYAFLPSPLLENMSRLHGQFNYGPWYFYLAAGVIWLFGYSLTLIRAIHLWVVVGSAVAAACWFRGSNRAAAPAFFALGFLYFFSTIEWPMARPDSLVTAFAIAMIVSAGAALTTSRARYWLLAGVAAACGAFTHLIAAALVPAVIAMLGVAVLTTRAETPAVWRPVALRSAVALAAGLALGAVMFYASFGFDLALQYRFLRGYRDVTASTDTYALAVSKHFAAAFGGLPRLMQASVLATLAAAWVLALAGAMWARLRRPIFAYVLPPATAWTFYFLSNGAYTNYHSGYAILHHALFLWTAASVLWVLLTLIEGRRASAVTGFVVSAIVLVVSIRVDAAHLAMPPRATAGAMLTPFHDYQARVLDVIPARATAWGSVLFGIESPDRIQLVQYVDAVSLALRLPDADRQTFAPDYVIWGHPDADVAIFETLHGLPASAGAWSSLEGALPESHFQLVSLTYGAPYGTTRVYARTATRAGEAPLPLVSVYDAPHGRWLGRLGAPHVLQIARTAPATLRVGVRGDPPASLARDTVVATLPHGAYLLRVSLRSAAGGSGRRLIAVVPAGALTQTIRQLRPDGEFVPYSAGDRQVFALLLHEGGALSINQFDDSEGAAIDAVESYPVGDLLDAEERPSRDRRLPEFSRWEPSGKVRTTLTAGQLHVDGDDSPLGYQVSTPTIAASEGDRIELRVAGAITSGRVCTGALNAAGHWLVPADTWREVLRFTGDGSGGFKLMFANCNTDPHPAPSRFDVGPGSYVDDEPEWYSDRLTSRGLGLDKPLASIATAADLGYSARTLSREGSAWKISGRADSRYSFVLRSTPRKLTTSQQVLITGRVTRGGVTLGLLQNEHWVRPTNIDTPGEFRLALVPPATNTYEIAVANFLGDDLETSIVIDRIEVYPAGRAVEP